MGIINYINETRAEFKHVTWPTRSQAILYTSVVVIFSLVIAGVLGFFDSIFASGLTHLIAR
jgi:preprotein translocase SecE subunit